mgnify:CR=1 FL=1
MTRSLRLLRDARLLVVAGLCVAVVTTAAQTKITAPKNKYPVSDDVKAGRDAAAQVEKEMPLLNEPLVGEYVAGIGQRLVAAIPPEQRHPEFTYTFKVVDQKDINAFALPGGPMFLNRGMIEAAKTEGEIAGVMAHEIGHAWGLQHVPANVRPSVMNPGNLSLPPQPSDAAAVWALAGGRCDLPD